MRCPNCHSTDLDITEHSEEHNWPENISLYKGRDQRMVFCAPCGLGSMYWIWEEFEHMEKLILGKEYVDQYR